MAVVFTAWVRYVADKKPWRPALLATRVFGADPYDHDESERALILADRLESFFRFLGVKTTLTELGIDDKDFEIMAKRATRNGKVGHYEPLDEESIREILKLAI